MCWMLPFFLDIFGLYDISFTEFRRIMPFLFCLFVRKIRGICLYLHKCQELSWLRYMLNILLAVAEYKGNREVMLQKVIDAKYCVCCLSLVMGFSLLSLLDASFCYHCKRSRTRGCTHMHARTHAQVQLHELKPFHIRQWMNSALKNLAWRIVTLEDTTKKFVLTYTRSVSLLWTNCGNNS
jgi:hypothetical protein